MFGRYLSDPLYRFVPFGLFGVGVLSVAMLEYGLFPGVLLLLASASIFRARGLL